MTETQPVSLRDRIRAALRDHQPPAHAADDLPGDEFDCCADAVMEVVTPALQRARNVTSMGRCRHCGARWEQDAHRMRCNFYVGPLKHEWIRTDVNFSMGGIDHECSCGRSVRVHDDSTPICPDADQDWRGPKPEADQ